MTPPRLSFELLAHHPLAEQKHSRKPRALPATLTEREREKKHHLPTLITKSSHLENGPKPKRKQSHSNHPFSGAMFVFHGVYKLKKNRCKLWVWPPRFEWGIPKKNLCPVIVRIVEGKRYHGTTYKTSGDLQVVTIPGKGVLSTQVIEEIKSWFHKNPFEAQKSFPWKNGEALGGWLWCKPYEPPKVSLF